MNIFDKIMGNEPEEIDDKHEDDPNKRVQGRIIKVSDDGWGFIISKAIPFTRIFFHWTSLYQSTLHFTELKSGMQVEFLPIQIADKRWRAIKIEVLPNEHNEE